MSVISIEPLLRKYISNIARPIEVSAAATVKIIMLKICPDNSCIYMEMQQNLC